MWPQVGRLAWVFFMKVSRFERARLIGARALQISLGAPPLFDDKTADPLQIAFREFSSDAIPLTVERPSYAAD